MKYLPTIIIGALGLGLLASFKKNGFPGSAKARTIANIKADMASALEANDTSTYEMLRLELEAEQEL